MVEQETKSNNTQPLSHKSLLSSLKADRVLSIVISLIILALVVGAAFFYHKHQESSLYSYNYSKSTYFYLTGNGKGYGIIIKRPDPIINPFPKITNDTNAAVFEQTKILNKNGKDYSYSIASFLTKSRPYPNKILGTVNYRDTIAKTINPSDPRYSDRIANIQAFAVQISPNYGTVKLGAPQPYTNSKIKKYAWVFDVKADPLGDEPLQQGKVLYVLGDNAWYYIMVTAEKHNWDNNQKFFSDILNSAAVDQ